MYCIRKRTRSNQVQPSQRFAAIRETTPFLSEEIIVNILSRVPGEFWENSIKGVCKSWAAIPRDPQFVKLHQLRAKPLLYIQETMPPHFEASFYTIEEKKSNLAHKRTPFPGQICDSNDGILLLQEFPMTFHVMNPSTLQVKKLPPVPKFCIRIYEDICNQIAWDIKCAKVVRTQNGKLQVICALPDATGAYFYWYTLAVDSHESSWRFCCLAKCPFRLLGKSVSISGVTYWSVKYNVEKKGVAIDLNGETAMIRTFLLPKEIDDMQIGDVSQLVKIGDHLGVTCWSTGAGEVKSWEMENLHQLVGWVRISCIELSKLSITRSHIILSVDFLTDQYLKVVIFQVFCKPGIKVLAFNLGTGKVRTVTFRKSGAPMAKAIGTHTYSFVPF